MSRLRRWMRVYGPEMTPGRFRMFGWPASLASDRHIVADLWQVVGGPRWSLAFVRIRKTADELEVTR